jgi:hypothetical protein
MHHMMWWGGVYNSGCAEDDQQELTQGRGEVRWRTSHNTICLRDFIRADKMLRWQKVPSLVQVFKLLGLVGVVTRQPTHKNAPNATRKAHLAGNHGVGGVTASLTT